MEPVVLSNLAVTSATGADPGGLPFLREMVVLFAVGAGLTYLCHRLRLVAIVGFLVAGVLVGPHALGLVKDLELIAGTAEVGVILLLFTLGVEFSLEKLARIKRYIVLGGSLQVGLTTVLAAVILMALGVGGRPAIYTGLLVALSSTAIVLKLLSERGAADTPAGRISLGMLIFQDLFIIPVVLLIPILAAGEGSTLEIAWAVVQATVIIAVVLIAARRVVPWLLDRVAEVHSPELFLLSVVVICFGIAWLANLGGVSFALGAFLAGLVVSGSRFREHAVGEIIPLRTIFNAVFFVSIGMLLDVRSIIDRPLLVLGAVLGVLLLKVLVTAVTVLYLRYPMAIALAVGLALAQIGEFSLVLHQVGSAAGLSPAGLGPAGDQVFLAVVVLLLIATPLSMHLEPAIRSRVEGWRRVHPFAPDEVSGSALSGLSDHVVIGGYGLTGRRLRSIFETFEIPFVIVDLNPVSVAEAEALGLPVVYGDLSQTHVLRRVGVERAKLVVIALNDPGALARIVQRTKLVNPRVEVIVRTQYIFDISFLVDAGADVVVTEELESAVHVIEHALCACGVPREEAQLQAEKLRADAELPP